MDVKIIPIERLSGELNAPPSKSYSHRAFFAASLAKGKSIIQNPLLSGDVEITINSLKNLGIKIYQKSRDEYVVEGMGGKFITPEKTINCGNSGTTIRILSSISLLLEGKLKLTGEFFNKHRPMNPLIDALKKLGVQTTFKDYTLHLERTRDECDDIEIPGNISSQFITSLLFIIPVLSCIDRKEIIIKVKCPISSYPYVQITMDVLNEFGIKIKEKIIENKEIRYKIPLNQKYLRSNFKIPGDFSSASFLMAAASITKKKSNLIIHDLNFKNPQGDKKIVELLNKMGANISVNEQKNVVMVDSGLEKYPLNGLKIDCQNIPDLFPILAVVGAFARDKTVLYNAQNLRYKESDRIKIISQELNKMGVNLIEETDRLTIFHCKNIRGININHEDDHRIAMALIIAAINANSPSIVRNVEIINDSFPNFLESIKKLGACYEILK